MQVRRDIEPAGTWRRRHGHVRVGTRGVEGHCVRAAGPALHVTDSLTRVRFIAARERLRSPRFAHEIQSPGSLIG
jgi:hypothetical protein